MRMCWLICAVGILTARVEAAEIYPYLEVDGQIYREVKFGAVNQGKVPLFHSRGMTWVTVDQLPDYVRSQIPGAAAASPPTPPAPAAQPNPIPPPAPRPIASPRLSHSEYSEMAAYREAAATMVVFNGRLVDRSTLTELTGFLTKVQVDGMTPGRDKYFIDLAVKTEKVPKQLELRPSLWKRTGECVYLKDYVPDDRALASGFVRTYGREIEPYLGLRAFQVGNPPTFEQWKRLRYKRG